ncbi:hypothetical protein [Salmonella phage SSBI34]|nr:hypothetical protein [Salmonella phage SSBI34]
MIATNTNRDKISHKNKLSYGEAKERITVSKANKQQRRKTRYSWDSL